MRDYIRGAWRDVTIQRDGRVLVDGETAGRVSGKPRAWAWNSPRGVESKGYFFTKRDAASSCADAFIVRKSTDSAVQ